MMEDVKSILTIGSDTYIKWEDYRALLDRHEALTRAASFVVDKAILWDEGPWGEGWPSPEMLEAEKLIISEASRLTHPKK